MSPPWTIAPALLALTSAPALLALTSAPALAHEPAPARPLTSRIIRDSTLAAPAPLAARTVAAPVTSSHGASAGASAARRSTATR